MVPTLDAILLSYPDLLHLGALPRIVSSGLLPSGCKVRSQQMKGPELTRYFEVYGTIPVRSMGLMFLYDAYLVCTNCIFEEVTAAFRQDSIRKDGPPKK